VVGATASDEAFVADWTARARTLLAEAVAKGVPARDVLATCQAVLAGFDEEQGDESS
jgi:hypothetical protein